VVDPVNKTVQSRNVNIATSDGNTAAVTGVSPGETVVMDGFDKLQDGTKVMIRKASPAVSTPNSRSASQTQPPAQGAANTQLNTSQQNAQQPQTSQPHPGRNR
jgi:multidrug efflux system membrane fusion protein